MYRPKEPIYQKELKDAICEWYAWPIGCLDALPYKAWAMIRDHHTTEGLNQIQAAHYGEDE